MALSKYEEQVVADFEAQFRAEETPPAPPRKFGKLALPLVCLVLGLAFLAAARHAGLHIRISDLWGFATGSVASGLSIAGHLVLLGSAFLLGRAWETV